MFLSCTARAHRHRHSFPTRRSSDLRVAPANSRLSAFTGVTLLENGDLLVSFRTGTGRDTPDGRLRIMRSRDTGKTWERSEEHTSELQSRLHLVCRLLLEKKKKNISM